MARPPRDPGHRRHMAARAWVREVLGAGVQVEDVSRVVGRLSVVWRLRDGDGDVLFYKQHEERKLFEREDHAYAHWLPRLRSVPGAHVPEVVARNEALGALMLTSLPAATPVSELTDREARRAAYRSAGRLLRALHELPTAGRAPDAIEHMRGLIARYVRPYADAVDRDTYDWIVAELDDGRPFAGVRYVCTHRDYSARNWVVDAAGTLSAFDWERAEQDVWLADVTRMEFDVWHEHPALRDAFFEGYGRALTDEDRRHVRLAVLIHALASVAWAATRNDAHFELLGRRVLARLRAES